MTIQSNFEVIEYWGIMDAEYAREVGIDLPDSVDDLDEVQINAWVVEVNCLEQLLILSHLIDYPITLSHTKETLTTSLVLVSQRTWTIANRL
jgi:hypothetical protein